MLVVPLLAIPSQTFNVTLNGQVCFIALYQKGDDLYVDLTVGKVVLMTCVIVRDRVLLVRQKYLGFIGDLIIADTQGTSDPVVSGLGTRFRMFYLSPGDVATIGAI